AGAASVPKGYVRAMSTWRRRLFRGGAAGLLVASSALILLFGGCAMTRSFWPLLVTALVSGASLSARAQERVDRFGDALPEHAVARMGSLRFQAGYDVA